MLQVALACLSLAGTTGWSPLYEFGTYLGIDGDWLSIAVVRPTPSDPAYIHQWFVAGTANYYSVITPPMQFVLDKQPPGISTGFNSNIDLVPVGDEVITMATTTQFGPSSLGIERRSATGAVTKSARPVCLMPEGYVNGMADANGFVHVVGIASSGGMTVYLALDATPDTPVVAWCDTLLASNPQVVLPSIVVGDRVHITFNGTDGRTDYIQYDLSGNVTVPVTDMVYPGEPGGCAPAALALTGAGDVRAFLLNNGMNRLFALDGETGQRLFDPVVIDSSGAYRTEIERCGTEDDFYLLWLDDGFYVIRFRVVDDQGGCVYDPGYAYSLSPSGSEYLMCLDAASEANGFLYLTTFFNYHDMYSQFCCPAFGYFTPGQGTGDAPGAAGGLDLSPSENPFHAGVVLTLSGSAAPFTLEVYDLAGRCVRSLEPSSAGSVAWDGCDGRGCPAASGVYFAVARAGDATAVCRLVRF